MHSLTPCVRFENVNLTLGETPVLRDLTFEARAGGRLGITGPTGSGKTVLMQMLLRRHDPDSGTVHLGGSDLRDLPLESVYRHCRIAPQEPVMFSLTLRENLLLGNPDAGEAELRRALHLSALEDDLPDLPDGLESAVGERGVTLSGGQRQRAAIARALLADPRILLLDDSLSAVDTATETRILERLLPALQGRGLWLVSHRYAALRHCDQVLVLEDGRITEAGSPEELLSRGGYFADLEARQRLQARLEEEA